MIHFDSKILHNFSEAQNREWLETNGLGGWASGTLSGAHTRRYHGLLIAAIKPPADRWVLLSKLDETIQVAGQRFEVGCNQFRDVVHPTGFKHIQTYEQNLFPCFTVVAPGIKIQKTLVGLHGENSTLIVYEIIDAPLHTIIEFTPLVAARPYHELRRANSDIRLNAEFSDGILRLQPYKESPEFYISITGATFKHQPAWHYNFRYLEEQQRGYDFEEDLFNYGIFHRKVSKGDKFCVLISTQSPRGRDCFQLFQNEQQRRSALLTKVAAKDELCRTLHLAADQFIVERVPELRSIVAGYHWFTDWGRDSMIALPGLCLVTQRFADARRILMAFAERFNNGLLPNNFDERGEPANYNTIDATLWFFVALYKYLQYTGDCDFVGHLLPLLHEVIESHTRGTYHDIHVAEDGLLSGGNPGTQLTWMDAKVGDWVVTPRQGKAVEINALWYNALSIMAVFCTRIAGHEAADYAARARVAGEQFNRSFWYGEKEYLFDYIDGAYRDNKLRPNQLLALSLPFPLLPEDKARKVLRACEQRLVTPYGLRTLSPDHPSYQRSYAGTQRTRDAAYHQGTVWPWLIGPYITALVRYEGRIGTSKAKQYLERFSEHFKHAGLGTVSEIFDAEDPQVPRGSISQAWSVAEILRAYSEDVL